VLILEGNEGLSCEVGKSESCWLVYGILVADVEILLVDHLYLFRPILLIVSEFPVLSRQLHLFRVVVYILFPKRVHVLELG